MKKLFELQDTLLKRIGLNLKSLSYSDQVQWTKEFILCMQAELVELLDWLPWKHWSQAHKPLTPERLKEIQIELIDIQHFLINLYEIWGITPKKLNSLFEEKHKINMKRQDDKY